jgi:alpha-methylacyl-CoA racemase
MSPCIAPVLGLDEAPSHPQHVARRAFAEVDGIIQPAPAPKFSRTPTGIDSGPPLPGQHTREVLSDWGVEDDQAQRWLDSGAVAEGATS